MEETHLTWIRFEFWIFVLRTRINYLISHLCIPRTIHRLAIIEWPPGHRETERTQFLGLTRCLTGSDALERRSRFAKRRCVVSAVRARELCEFPAVARREVANEPPSAKGGFASRPMVARLVRYGPVRQKKTFLCEFPAISIRILKTRGTELKIVRCIGKLMRLFMNYLQ
jgi:hypothetical protein